MQAACRQERQRKQRVGFAAGYKGGRTCWDWGKNGPAEERPRPRGWTGPRGRQPKRLTLEARRHDRRLTGRTAVSDAARRGTNAQWEVLPCRFAGRFCPGKKRGSNRSWSLMIGPKPNRKWGREQGRRRCALPMNLNRGRRRRFRFSAAIRGPREEDTERVSATMAI